MSTNKVIAKNTLFLYFRMILLLVIGLYTSRVVLQTLGVSDYGLYSVVGGVVAMMGFMHSTLSGATTRFLNVEMAQGTEESKRKIFSTSVFIHLGLCVVLLILGETAGLWFVMHKLNIPEGRYAAAMIVYQISILAVLFTVMQIPYDAAIIAHEKMNIYAYLSLFDAAGKLLIVFLIQVLPWDRLVMYALFTLLISIISRMIAQIYCRRKFPETTFLYRFDKKMFREIMGFFGWDLFGNFSLMLKNQGTNILQNLFFGTKVNAAVSLDNTLYFTLNGFYSNFILALKPQIIQSYANKNYERMYMLLFAGAKFSFFLLSIIVLPLLFDLDFFLKLWLKTIPDFLSSFFKISLVISLLSAQNPLLSLLIQASGNNRRINVLTSFLFLIVFPVNYLLFKIGYGPITSYLISLLITIVFSIVILFNIRENFKEFNILYFVFGIIFKNWLIFFIAYFSPFLIGYFFSGLLSFWFYKSFIGIIILLFLFWTVGISKKEKSFLLNLLKIKK